MWEVRKPAFPSSSRRERDGRRPGENKIYTTENLFGVHRRWGGALSLVRSSRRCWRERTRAKASPTSRSNLFEMRITCVAVCSRTRERRSDSAFGHRWRGSIGLLLFWKDRFYVSILASPDFALARSLEAQIPDEGPLPGVPRIFPAGFAHRGERPYFHRSICQLLALLRIRRNILHISEHTEVVLTNPGRRRGVVSSSSSSIRATWKAGSRDGFRDSFPAEMDLEPVAQIEDSTWAGCRGGSVLAIMFNAPRESQWALDKVQAIIESKDTGIGGTETRWPAGGDLRHGRTGKETDSLEESSSRQLDRRRSPGHAGRVSAIRGR